MPITLKKCKHCGGQKQIYARGVCQICYIKKWRRDNPDNAYITHRRYRLRKLYNISLEQYDEMLKSQRGRCAICRTKSCRSGKPFAVDHSRKTGKVRGLLCIRCNQAVGQMNDDPRLFDATAEYLRGRGGYAHNVGP